MSLKRYSVIMGDIVKSRKTDSEVELYRNFNDIIKDSNHKFMKIIVSPLTITLGDEFQGLTRNLIDSFYLANQLRIEFLKRNINMRFVIADCEIDSQIINKDNSWNMLGKGLAEARELLNNKKIKNSYRFNFLNINNRETIDLLEKVANTLGESMTNIEQKWNENQIHTILKYRNEEQSKMQLAEKMGKNRSSLYRSLKSAQINLYEMQEESIISILNHINEINGKN